MSSLRNNYDRITNKERTFLIRTATSDGSILGDDNANVDGSSTPIDFWVQPDINDNFEISQITLEVSDGGSPDLDDYGNIIGPLINGIQFFTELNGVRFEFPRAINSNRELINLGLIVDRFNFSGNVTVSNFTFDLKTFAENGIFLNGGTNDKFGFTIRDNLSTLIQHTLNLKGSIRSRVVS